MEACGPSLQWTDYLRDSGQLISPLNFSPPTPNPGGSNEPVFVQQVAGP